jgi:peptidoglycan/LPS O-acetylase OafA/YrhL
MSYGTYLLHMIVLIPVVFLLLMHTSYAHLRAAPRFLLLFVAVLALTQSAACVAHKFIEQPGINLGRKILRHKMKPVFEPQPQSLR